MGPEKFAPGILPEIGLQPSGRIQPQESETRGTDQGMHTRKSHFFFDR